MRKRSKAESHAPVTDGRARPAWLLPAILILLTFAVYYPAWHGAALWDDVDHLTRPELQATDGLFRIWFDVGATLQHYPVLHTTFWIEHKLFGDAMTGYHLVNIAMHGLAALLLASTLRRLAVPGGLLIAAIFALHPVQVESVAWITELKNTLSTVFYLAAALLYLRFDQTRSVTDYLLTAGTFLLALLSKTVAGTLPMALLIVLWWKHGRLDLRRDVAPLVPFAVLGIGAGLMTAWWEREFNRTTLPEFDLTLLERVLVAGRAIVFHLSKLVWPANLTFSYPRWHIDAAVWWQYAFPLGVGAALAAAWVGRRWSRAPLAGVLFFCVTLGPTLGFFNLYTFRYSFVADHYQYVACIGVITVVVAGLTRVAERWSLGSSLRAAAAMVILVPLALVTWSQSHQYADRDTLYAATIARNPSSVLAHVNLGNDLERRGRFDDAVTHYRAALAIDPGLVEAHENLGVALQKMGQHDAAAREMREALRISPDAPGAHRGLGVSWQGLGRFDDAIREFREALRLKPGYAEAHLSLAATLDAQGRAQEAIDEYRESVRFDPRVADAHYRFGNALMRAGRPHDAITEFGEAISLAPAMAEYHNNLGLALEQTGRLDDALNRFTDALRLRPDSALIENNIGGVLIRMKRLDEAADHLRRALQIDEGYTPARENLTRALARQE